MTTIHLSANEASRLGLLEPIEDAFCAQMVRAGLDVRERDVLFHDERQWRADYVVVVCDSGGRTHRVMVELDGGIFDNSRGPACRVCRRPQPGAHGTGKGIMRDIEKSNEAQRLGYLFVRIPTHWVRDSRGNMITRGIDYLQLFIETIKQKKVTDGSSNKDRRAARPGIVRAKRGRSYPRRRA
ncbi:MAG TPA: hypothetical protein VF747_09240 [Blastocatellia bacterium]|jgi:hypothetical protein